MKHIMISIRPEYVCNILNKEKILEIRKSFPKEECIVEVYETKSKWRKPYFSRAENRILHYETFGRGKVVARWHQKTVDKFDIPFPAYWNELNDYVKNEISKKSCLTLNELHHYLRDKTGYAWHIENLEIYDKPKELAEFGLKRPPQSWCYVKGEKDE